LRQDAVLLRHGAGNAAARAFLEFLRSATATRIIAGHGHDRPPEHPPARQ
jgi:molybdate transport system substrate-binding protein